MGEQKKKGENLIKYLSFFNFFTCSKLATWGMTTKRDNPRDDQSEEDYDDAIDCPFEEAASYQCNANKSSFSGEISTLSTSQQPSGIGSSIEFLFAYFILIFQETESNCSTISLDLSFGSFMFITLIDGNAILLNFINQISQSNSNISLSLSQIFLNRSVPSQFPPFFVEF